MLVCWGCETPSLEGVMEGKDWVVNKPSPKSFQSDINMN